MYSDQFQMVNFTPREGSHDRLNQILQDITESGPSDAYCSAIIEKRGDTFIFRIVLRSMNEVFQANCEVDSKEERCRSRTWHEDIVNQLHEELRYLIGDWHQRRFAA